MDRLSRWPLRSFACRASMLRRFVLAVTAVLLLPASWVVAQDEPTTVRIMLGNVGSVDAHDELARRFEARNPDVDVEIIEGPEQTDALLLLVLDLFASASSAVDIIAMDVIWPGLVADHMIDLSPYIDADVLERHLPQLVENNRVDGRLVAVPWFTDIGVLFYRSDLLEAYGFDPPTTWAELEQQARTIQDGERANGDPDFWGFVFQGNAYEGLTVDALEWIASNGGGTIVDADGTVTIDNDAAVEALARADGWIDAIAPADVTAMNEEASRRFFQAGNAAFLRNWPYVYSLANADDSPVAGDVDVVQLPAGTGPGARHATVLGGWGMGVSRYSRNPEAAARVVAFFTSEEAQRFRAVTESYTPTIESLLTDPEVVDANPFYEILGIQDAVGEAVRRPSAQTGDRYADVSRLFWRAVHDVIEGDADPAAALDVLALDLADLLSP